MILRCAGKVQPLIATVIHPILNTFIISLMCSVEQQIIMLSFTGIQTRLISTLHIKV